MVPRPRNSTWTHATRIAPELGDEQLRGLRRRLRAAVASSLRHRQVCRSENYKDRKALSRLPSHSLLGTCARKPARSGHCARSRLDSRMAQDSVAILAQDSIVHQCFIDILLRWDVEAHCVPLWLVASWHSAGTTSSRYTARHWSLLALALRLKKVPPAAPRLQPLAFLVSDRSQPSRP